MVSVDTTNSVAPASGASTAPGFFIPQASTSTPAKNISESPVLTKPAGGTNSAGSAVSSPRNNRRLFILAGIVLAVIAIGVAGFFVLNSRQAETQAPATPQTAKITLSQPSTTIPGNSEQTISFSLDLSKPPAALTDIEFSLLITGEVPADPTFKPQLLTNFRPADVALIPTDTGKKLTVIFKAPTDQSFTATTSRVSLGTLTFTSPPAGQMIIQFNAAESKVLLKSSQADILQPTGVTTYSIEAVATATPSVAQNELIQDATESATTIATSSATPSVALTATVTPTKTVVANTVITTISPTAIPTATAQTTVTTKTPTIAPTKIPTKTPVPTQARQSSLPAETQAKPVSGSADVTIELIMMGGLLIGSGVALIKKFPEKKKAKK